MMRRLLFLALIAGAGYAVLVQWPEIQRYMKIRAM